MIEQIKTVEDVKVFFNELMAEGLNFHPDDPFSDYVHTASGEQLYSDQEAVVRDNLLEQAFEACEKEGADIYDLCIDIFMAEFYKNFPPEL